MYHKQILLQGGGGKDSVLREGNGCMFQLGKMKRIEIPGMIFVQQCFCYISFFWPLCCFSPDMKTSKYSWDPPPLPLPFACVVMRQPTQCRSREEIYSGMWRKCSWFWQKNTLPFKLLCSTFVVSDCFLSSGCRECEAVLSNICQRNGTWMLGREPSAPTSHSTAYPGVGKIFRRRLGG